MGLNLTGTLDTGEYTLGRGIVYLAPLSGNLPTLFRDIGNTTELNVNVETETLEHQSSRAGLAVIDKEIVVSQKMAITITFDSINFQNLALFFSGTTDDQNITAAGNTVAALTDVIRYLDTTGAEAAFPADTNPFWFDIFQDRYNATPVLTRLYNLEGDDTTNAWNTAGAGVKLEAVDTGDLNPVNLEEGTDFTVDRVIGRVFINTTGIAKITASGRSAIRVVTAESIAPAADTTVDEVRGLRTSTIALALKFVEENPANNSEKTEYQFHKVTLRSEGDFSLIGDEFRTGQVAGTVEENATADPNSPFVTVRTYSQTS